MVVVELANAELVPVRLAMKAFVIEAPTAEKLVVEAVSIVPVVAVRLPINALASVAPVAERLVVEALIAVRKVAVVVASVVVPVTVNAPVIFWFPRKVVVPIVAVSRYA